MIRNALRTPARLHFGLLSWGEGSARQFGGVGLMVDEPGLTVEAGPSSTWSADGPLSARVLTFAERAAGGLGRHGRAPSPLAFRVTSAPPEHSGFGLGTQLGLAVARLVAEASGLADPSTAELAGLSGRGLRSGIGLHGFALGGLIVDGGRGGPGGIPPLLARLEFPGDWRALVVLPGRGTGLHGPGEARAFAELPPSTDALTDRLCRLVLLDLLPAVVERDLARFGSALEEIQRRVGQGFAPAQGGTFARPEWEVITGLMREVGLQGVGQSSWGPALYGFTDLDGAARADLLAEFLARASLGPGSATWTAASPTGARWLA